MLLNIISYCHVKLLSIQWKFKYFSFTVKQQGLFKMKFKCESKPQFFKERAHICFHQVLLDELPLQNAVGLPRPQAHVPGCFSKPGILTGLIQVKLTAGRMGNFLIWAPFSLQWILSQQHIFLQINSWLCQYFITQDLFLHSITQALLAE